ncbi:MAG TPA: SH3 domain-containing protein [Cyclobacteriaceae bacterium]|nr:SH3 domain-containing protein [Cyclobacteriaceae bacterium]
MQNSVLKFLTSFSLTVCLSHLALGQSTNNPLLQRADSLFQQKRYTQSFEIYNTLFESHRYSPAMLLKMAYVQEGLNRISQSAYYLNLYYLATRDESALSKLEELADKYRLEGYEPSQLDKMMSIYQQYRNLITLCLISAIIFLMVFMIVQRLRFHSKPYAAWGMLITLSIIFLVHTNFSERYSKAIITTNNTYLMNGPSAGASVISIVRDGHRVQVLGKEDVWLKVQWGDRVAYIKESNLLPVKL